MIVAYQINPFEEELEFCLTLSSNTRSGEYMKQRKILGYHQIVKSSINSNAELLRLTTGEK